MWKKTLLFLILIFIFLPFISAPSLMSSATTLGTYKRNQSINLIQNCINSTSANITRIILPNSSFVVNGEESMIKSGDDYSYPFNNTNQLGIYLVYGNCDENGMKANWAYDFEITTTGQEMPQGTLYLSIIIIFFIVIAFLTVIAYMFRERKIVLYPSLFIILILIISGLAIALQIVSTTGFENIDLIIMSQYRVLIWILYLICGLALIAAIVWALNYLLGTMGLKKAHLIEKASHEEE